MNIASFQEEALTSGEPTYKLHAEVRAKYMNVNAFPRPRVLCLVGNRMLGETRRMVLQRRYDAVCAGSLEELADLAFGQPFDVIVLCHTLAAEASERCLQFAKGAWPGAKVVAVASDSTSSQPKFGKVVCGLAGPGALLSAVEQVLQATPSGPASEPSLSC